METKFGKFIATRAFAALFFAVLIAAMGYVGLRIGNAAEWAIGARLYAPIAALLLAMLVMLAYSQKAAAKGRFGDACKRVSAYFLCFLVYDVPALLVCDLAALLFGFGHGVRARLVLAAAALSALLLAYGRAHARRIETVTYRVELEGRGRETRLALMSDLHIGLFVRERHLRRAVEKVNTLKPALAVIAGDLFDGCLPRDDGELRKIAAVFREIQAPGGVYAVVGNHDPSATDERFRRFLNEANIRLLYNEATELPAFTLIGRAGIVGMQDVRAPLEDMMRGVNPEKPAVVLDHDPQGIREAAACGADLVLCGHTHRGQFFPMTCLTRLANGRDYFYGQGVFGKTHAVICAGTGFFALPVRIGTDCEVAAVDISYRARNHGE